LQKYALLFLLEAAKALVRVDLVFLVVYQAVA
jgi:hypothetical protein